MADFSKAIGKLISKEGRNTTNLKNDKGGLTKFGISAKAYPNLDITNLTEAEATDIYKRDYWDVIRLDDVVSQPIAEKLFEAGVNFGVVTTVKLLQEILGVSVDGKVGTITINALNGFKVETRDTASLFNVIFTTMAVNRYRNICNKDKTQKEFLLGWLNRVFE